MAEIGGEWKSRSIFLEVKPRSDLASLFVDCPPSVLSAALSSKENCDGADSEKKVNGTTKTFSRPQTPAEVTACVKNGNGIEGLEVVRVLEHCVQLGAPPLLKDLVESKRSQRRGSDSSVGSAGSGGSGRKKKSRSPQNGPRFGASIRGLSMAPRTLCAPTWADNHRLFMCKVHAESKGAPLVPKTFHKLARDMCDFDKLEAFANRGQPQLSCSRCSASLLLEENKMTIGCLPDDEWLATSQSADFYCRDSCGAACDPDRHKHGKHGSVDKGKAANEWLPTPTRLMISYTNVVVFKESILENSVEIEGKNVICTSCRAELGRVQKYHSEMFSFNHLTATLTVGGNRQPYIEKTPQNISVFMAQLVLSTCEAQGSLKLIVRSLDRTPHLLIWLLDSYVILATGQLEKLEEDSGDESGVVLNPFPAVKLLYKVFDAVSAASDPRANGEDSSVGLLEIPLNCCMQLMEVLLKSSHRLPPACRSVGQFYVGFLQFDDHI